MKTIAGTQLFSLSTRLITDELNPKKGCATLAVPTWQISSLCKF